MKTFTIYFSIFILFTACPSKANIVKTAKQFSTNKEASTITATNSFGLTLFQNLENSTNNKNFMISPLSISMAFSMVYNGANGETKEQIAKALEIESFSLEEVNAANANLLNQLFKGDEQISIHTANSIWLQNDFQVQHKFQKSIENYYKAKVTKADFTNSKTVEEINNWVSEQTNHKITEIIKSISPDEVLFLINTLYFKGDWTNAFDDNKTTLETFTIEGGQEIETLMMNRTDSMFYFKNEQFAAIELPYGNGQFAMNILLPNESSTVRDITNRLTAESWRGGLQCFVKRQNVKLKLPKFKIEYELPLNDLLMQMGMKDAFSAKADFSKINEDKTLQISSAIHKTYIEVDEVGTEAAAVTSIGFKLTSMPINAPKTIPFYCNKPFLFIITETKSGSIIFMGQLGNPLN